ncbi:MAG: glycoside hydrolase family 27 protein [Bacteroidales bacterium]|nr:glycoside hydrolase family 27 protein [Bacteroidales bacterium]
MMKKVLLFTLLIYPLLIIGQNNTKLAQTPPMGWNSWNKFGCDVSEKLIMEMADALVSSGMKDAGYEYVVIDDCWQVARDADGNIVPDKERFPSGMKALADYIHSKGLKFGLYSCAGTGTCQNRPGSYSYEEKDAKQYAEWGVDYLKYDWCNTEGLDPKVVYPKMSNALKATGRPIIFSMCEFGLSSPWYWAPGVAHLWRTTGDIQDCWDCKHDWGGKGWVLILDEQEGLEKFAGPGHWNDPDMLEVGNGKLTIKEYEAHFSFWCLLAAPLMAGNDIRNMSDTIKNILTNTQAIAVNQDAAGIQGSKILDEGSFEVWRKQLKGGDIAIILFNRGEKSIDIDIKWQKLGLGKSFSTRDLWKKADLGKTTGYTGQLEGHSVLFYRLKK